MNHPPLSAVPARTGPPGDVALPQAAPSSLSIRFALPLAWDPLDQPPAPQQRERAGQGNAGVIAFLLQEIEIEAGPRPADEGLIEALAPLRLKLDMILDLFARHAYRDIELPPVREVELGASRIAWEAPLSLRLGNWLKILIYLHPTFREPVVLFGRVTGTAKLALGAGYRIEADLAETPEHILGDLARLAFLIQRRQRGQRVK